MDNVTKAYKSRFYAITNAFLLLLAILPSSYPIVVPCIFTCVLMLYIYIEKFLKITLFDIVIIALLLYEFVLNLFTFGLNNGTQFLINQYSFTAYYYILRLSLKEKETQKLFLSILTIAFCVISLFCIASFEIFKNKVYSAGFESLYDFKYLYRPLGEINNIWATFSFCFFGVALLSYSYIKKETFKKWYIYLPIVPILYCIIISFSRGIYISAGILIFTILGVISLKSNLKLSQRFLTIICSIIVLICLSIPNMKDVSRTIKMTETVSQKRSLSSRVNSLPLLMPVLKNYPLLGVGTANYSLAVNKYVYEDDNNSITSFAPNILMQLLIEKGIIGTLLWISVIAIFLITMIKSAKVSSEKNKIYFILLFLFALLIRELSFPSYFVILNIQLLVAIVIALPINWIFNQMNSNYIAKVNSKNILIPILILFIPTVYLYSIAQLNKGKYKEFINAIETRQLDEAEKYLIDCKKITPTFLYYGSLNWLKFKDTSNKEFLLKADNFIEKAIELNSNDAHLLHSRAIIAYYKGEVGIAKNILGSLVNEFPQNTLYRTSLGNLLYINGDKSAAVCQYAKAIELTPSILEGDQWKKFCRMDSVSTNEIIKNIKLSIFNSHDDPIFLAKSGKLYYILGDFHSAKTELSNAVKHLPNLRQPWYYLALISASEGDEQAYDEFIKKANLCGEYMNSDAKEKVGNAKEKPMDFYFENYDSFSNYFLRFEMWYKTSWNYEHFEITFF